jgi:hypothetical protein
MSPANRAATARNTPPKPIEVTAELKALLRRLKLGRLLDTLPERLALARSEHLPHHDFLEMLLADADTRRDRQSALVRAKTSHLEPGMHLDAWDESTKVTYDRQLWAELTSLRFLADSYNVLIMGPVGVGKPPWPTLWATPRSAASTPSTPNAPTRCSSASRPHGWTTPTTRRCGNCTGSNCSSSTTWPCTRWMPCKPTTSTS